jgi:hypothetical protein
MLAFSKNCGLTLVLGSVLAHGIFFLKVAVQHRCDLLCWLFQKWWSDSGFWFFVFKVIFLGWFWVFGFSGVGLFVYLRR